MPCKAIIAISEFMCFHLPAKPREINSFPLLEIMKYQRKIHVGSSCLVCQNNPNQKNPPKKVSDDGGEGLAKAQKETHFETVRIYSAMNRSESMIYCDLVNLKDVKQSNILFAVCFAFAFAVPDWRDWSDEYDVVFSSPLVSVWIHNGLEWLAYEFVLHSLISGLHGPWLCWIVVAHVWLPHSSWNNITALSMPQCCICTCSISTCSSIFVAARHVRRGHRRC